MKKATFPNPKSLQPMPTDVNANISGNTNSTVGHDSTTISDLDNSSNNTQVTSIPTTENNMSNNETFPFYIFGIILVLLIVSIIFFIYRKVQQEKI